MKKLIVPSTVAVLLVIVLVTTALAAPALAGQKELPFKGTLQAVETYVVSPPIMSVTAHGSGNTTHLGRYTISYEVEVNLETISGIGSAHFVAANGDSLDAEGTGQATPTDTPDVFHVIEVYTVTGGTGRFAGASGQITLDRVVNTTTGATSGTIHGTIVLP